MPPPPLTHMCMCDLDCLWVVIWVKEYIVAIARATAITEVAVGLLGVEDNGIQPRGLCGRERRGNTLPRIEASLQVLVALGAAHDSDEYADHPSALLRAELARAQAHLAPIALIPSSQWPHPTPWPPVGVHARGAVLKFPLR